MMDIRAIGLVFLALTACNVEPTPFTVAIGPERATAADDLKVLFLSNARDVNSDEVTYQYAWYANDQLRSEFTTDTVPASATQKGQTWRVEVTATDGKKESETQVATVTIENSPPTAEIQADFTEVKSTEELVVSATGIDPDGDTIEIRYYWTQDGKGTPVDGPKVSPAFTAPGQRWTAYAVAFDGVIAGPPSSIEILVLNAEPTVDGVTMSPDPVFTNTDLTATVVASDPDNQPVKLTYTWKVDGRQVASGVGLNTLSSEKFDKDQEIELTVVPNDGVSDGVPFVYETVVKNSPPTAPTVQIVPDEPIPKIDDMRCELVTPSTDADGDEIEYRVEWMVNGALYYGATTTYDGDTVLRGSFFDEEVWTCRMIPFDEDDDGVVAELDVIPDTWSGPREFSTCDTEGSKGPKQTDCDGSDGYKGTRLQGEVKVTAGIQEWTVPVDGRYRITAYGAQGSASTSSPYKYAGGYGAVIRGDFTLRRGDVLKLAVGQEGGSDGYNAGGGGATWVMKSDGTPLVVAGGGGASSYYGSYNGRMNGCNASATQYGMNGSGSSYSLTCSAKTSSLRQGGAWKSTYTGNGGGGIDTNGGSESYTWLGTGGKAWKNGADGGTGGGTGGFGGGGAGAGSYGSGGGGGYSGGDAGYVSGGGGSYNGGTNPSNTVTATGPGRAVIDFLGF